MNCIFCLKPAHDGPEMALDQCSNCQNSGWSVKYNTNGYLCATDPFPDINWLALFNENNYIELDYNDNQTRLFSWSAPYNKYFLLTSLEGLEKINPSNVGAWLKRLLNLKVFY